MQHTNALVYALAHTYTHTQTHTLTNTHTHTKASDYLYLQLSDQSFVLVQCPFSNLTKACWEISNWEVETLVDREQLKVIHYTWYINRSNLKDRSEEHTSELQSR